MRLTRGTTRTRQWRLRDAHEVPANLTGATVVLEMDPVRDNDPTINRAVTVDDASSGVVSAAPASDPAMATGVYRCRFHVTFGDSTEDFFPDETFDIVVDP